MKNTKIDKIALIKMKSILIVNPLGLTQTGNTYSTGKLELYILLKLVITTKSWKSKICVTPSFLYHCELGKAFVSVAPIIFLP